MSTLSIFASAPETKLPSGGSQVWSWTFPGAPITINLSRALIARLQADVDARTRVHAHREIGGLLFGHQRGKGPVVEIDDYSWIPSELAQDGSYSVSKAELDRARAQRAGSTSVVIGYFRTDSQDNLELRDAELDLMTKQFAAPLDVALLICSSKPHSGGFFFWMGEGVMSPFSLMDFPLDVARLKFHDDSDAAGSVTESRASAPDPPVAVSFPLPLPVSAPPPTAAPIKDADPHLLPWPLLERAPVKRAAVLRPQPLEELPVEQTAPVVLAEIKQAPVKDAGLQEADLKRAALQQADLQEVALEQTSVQHAGAAAPARSRSVWFSILWAVTLLIGLSAVAGFIVVFNGGTLPWVGPAHTAKATPAPRFPLQLNVEAQGTGLNIRWDAQSAPVTDAREGRLTILDVNKAPEVISLTADQLATGHIYFQSPAERLEIQLETTSNAGVLTRESVLALSSSPHTDTAARPAGSPAQVGSPSQTIAGQPKPALHSSAASPTPSAPAPVPVRKVETIQIPSQIADAGPTGISERPADSRFPARAFSPPSSSRTLPRVPVIDQPAVAAPQQSPSVPLPVNTVLNTRVAPPPPPQAVTASTPAPPPQPITQPLTQPIRVTSGLQAARLVKRVTPIYPSVAIGGRIQGVVRFGATISRDGRIEDLKLLAGPSVLAKAASDAVKQWTYRPTVLNGQAVEVVTEIDVNFTLSQ